MKTVANDLTETEIGVNLLPGMKSICETAIISGHYHATIHHHHGDLVTAAALS